jgi:hypothetical protein
MSRAPEAGWFRLRGMYWLDPKLLAVSLDAEALYVRCLGLSKTIESYGVIPANAIAAASTKLDNVEKAADELLMSSLWTVHESGFAVPKAKWDAWQESAADVELAKRRKKAAALTRWHGQHDVPVPDCPQCDAQRIGDNR